MRKRIVDWMEEVIKHRRDLSFDDLHIDDINPRFRARDAWVTGAVECLEVALLHRNTRKLPFTVAAGISLRSAQTPAGVSFHDLTSVSSALDDSPPSLYVFPLNAEPWRTDRDFRELSPTYTPVTNLHMRSFFRQWFDDNDAEFRRSFWLAG